MARSNHKFLSDIMVPACQALSIGNLTKKTSFTRCFFRSARAIGVAFIVVATLLSSVDASAISRRRATKYGTLSYSIHNLSAANSDSRYKPGDHFIINATFAANDKVFGKQSSYIKVMAGGQVICSRTVVVKKNKTSSTAVSFNAPSDGSTLKIIFSNTGNDVFESFTITAIKQDVVKQEDSSTTTDENSNNDTGNADESTADDADTGNADEENPAEENPAEENPVEENPIEDFLSNLTDNELMQAVQEWLASDPMGLDRQATPEEAVGVGSVAALLAALLGGAGAVGGGVGGALGGLGGLGGGAAGGGMPAPIEGPGGPSNPFQRIEDKYVTRDPDGSITIKDPVTGEQRLYLPDGQGGYDNPLGGGFKSEEDMLNHLAYLDRNSGLLSQDAETAARNQAEQHAQWEAQNARDLERGYSDEMAEYRDLKAVEEKKEALITKLANKYCVEADEESVRRAIKEEQIQAGVESAKQQAEAARNDMIVVGLESIKNVAATSLVMIPLALSGVGTVSVATMGKAKLVQSCFTMAKEVTDKVGDAYVKGEDLGKAAVYGVATGTVNVVQNYAGDIGGAAAGKLAGKASELAKGALNLGTEAAVVIGTEGAKEGLKEYHSSGDLKKTLDKTLEGMQKGAVKHAVNKTMEYGLNKGKELLKSSRPNPVATTRAKADEAGKTVTARQQAVSRSQDQVTAAQQRVTTAQQNATRSQQRVDSARWQANTAKDQLRTAKGQMEAAQQRVGLAKTPAEASRAQAELAKAQKGVATAQQNVDRATSNLASVERLNAASQRVAVHAESDLQKAQFGVQKAQGDLKTATAQHEQALRDAYAAEQQAQVDQFNDKMMAHMGGGDIVGGYREYEDFNENIDKISKEK